MPLTEDYAFKIIIVGDSSVGKSCLLRRFQGEIFDDGYPATFGIDFVMRRIEIDDSVIKLVIWDTAGQERFQALTRSYFQNADAVLVAFDISCATSFYHVPRWIEDARRHGKEDIKIVLVACKCDIVRNRVIERHESQKLANELGIMLMETSAKEMVNVHETFISLAAQLKYLAELNDRRLFERNRSKTRDFGIKIRRPLYVDENSDKSAVVEGSSLRSGRPSACYKSGGPSSRSKCT